MTKAEIIFEKVARFKPLKRYSRYHQQAAKSQQPLPKSSTTPATPATGAMDEEFSTEFFKKHWKPLAATSAGTVGVMGAGSYLFGNNR